MPKVYVQFSIGILILILLSNTSISQMPFQQKSKFSNRTKPMIDSLMLRDSTSSKFIRKYKQTENFFSLNGTDFEKQNLIDQFNEEQKNEEDKINVFDQFGSGLVLGDDTKTLFPTINGEIINYRLSFYTDNNSARHYIPISIISKVSGSNKNNTGTLNDATSFFGSPFTFRTTTAFLDKQIGKENRIVVGMHNDLRIVTVGDTLTSKIETSFGYYGAFGFTYFGKGEVYNDLDPSTKWDGAWSFSALLYLFSSGGTFNKAVFGNYDKKNLSGLELLLRFKTSNSEKSKFNLLVGGNYGFTKGAPNFEKWSFRLGVGN